MYSYKRCSELCTCSYYIKDSANLNLAIHVCACYPSVSDEGTCRSALLLSQPILPIPCSHQLLSVTNIVEILLVHELSISELSLKSSIQQTCNTMCMCSKQGATNVCINDLVAQGEFHCGVMHGQGHFTWRDGVVYEVSFFCCFFL